MRFLCRAALKAGLGSWGSRALFDALPYSQYATGLQVAARYAAEFGESEIVAIEFGVAGGNGLLALADHARGIRQTGITVHVVGFDTGVGLPPTEDWRDAPWIYRSGDYPGDAATLTSRLAGRATLVLGDIRETFPRWLRNANKPVGFISIDVDYYSSTMGILDALANCEAEAMLPISSVYLDDILCFGVPRCVGELAALADFNRDHPSRKFDRADWIGEFRPYKEALWLKRMFDFYCFDHLKMKCPAFRDVRRLDLVG
jgi:hypothetical protein